MRCPLHAKALPMKACALFSWDDLIARLSAAQEFRAAMAQVPVSARASFDAIAAQHLAKRGFYLLPGGKPGVNPVASANGKGDGGNDHAEAETPPPPVRGIA